MISAQTLKKVTIFFSFASESEDKEWFEKLQKQLSVQMQYGLIEVLHDSLISAGKNTGDILKSYIRKAHIIVLLISADFFSSKRCIDLEVPYALERQRDKAALVIPVLLRPTEWTDFPLDRSGLLPHNGQAVSDWTNRDKALAEVATGIRQAASQIVSQLLKTSIQMQPSQFHDCTLPYRQNQFFTDRKDILEELQCSFASGQNIQIRTQVLYGARGMGKTTIAIEYAYRHQHEYQNILWLNTTPPELLSANIIMLADQLGIPASSADKQQHITAFRHWLRSNEKWLVVLDNLEDFSLINQLVPLQGNGHVLAITHTQVTEKSDAIITVTSMNTKEGALLLLQRASIIPAQSTYVTTSEANFLHALHIAQAVEGSPLALDLAGAYIQEDGLTLASYLKRYRWQQRRPHPLSKRWWLTKNHRDPITITLALSLKKIARVSLHALQLLRFFAFLHPDTISREIITNNAFALTGLLYTIASDPLVFNDALSTLQKFSLLHPSADSTTLLMHSSVQLVIRDGLTNKQQYRIASQVVRLINAAFPEVRFETWEQCERYVSQAQRCAALIQDFHLPMEEGGLLLERLGFYYYQRGCYVEAHISLTQALRLQEQLKRSDPANLAQTLNSLGLVSQRQGRYQEARVLHQRALKLRESIGDHAQIAESLHNLAVLYEYDGHYHKAEQLYLRILALDEQTAEADHPDTTITLNNLALMYYLQGDYPQAEATYQRVLIIQERSLPPNHPNRAYTLNGLGALAEKRGDNQQAIERYERASAIREQVLGKEHSETAQSINTSARIAELRGNYQQAQDLYQQALVISEKTLGPEHPDVAQILNNLASLAYKQEQYQQTQSLYLHALSIYELAPTTRRPAMAQVLNNLGQLYHKTHNEKEAEERFRQALAIREQAPGMTHPDTAQSLDNLADLLVDQRRYEAAEPLLQRALAILLQKFGPAYPDVIRMQAKYDSLLKHMWDSS